MSSFAVVDLIFEMLCTKSNLSSLVMHIRVTVLLFLGDLSFLPVNCIFINLCDKLNYVPRFLNNINKIMCIMNHSIQTVLTSFN